MNTYTLEHPKSQIHPPCANQRRIRKGAKDREMEGKNERVRGHKLGKVTATDPNDSMIIAW